MTRLLQLTFCVGIVSIGALRLLSPLLGMLMWRSDFGALFFVWRAMHIQKFRGSTRGTSENFGSSSILAAAAACCSAMPPSTYMLLSLKEE